MLYFQSYCKEERMLRVMSEVWGEWEEWREWRERDRDDESY
jgi:hypothetical protein